MHVTLLQLSAWVFVSAFCVRPYNMPVCTICMCNLPSVSLFPGQCCTSPNPQLWGSLWGSQTGWQCQSPGMLARQHTWEPAQRAHACGIWRKRRSPGHFSIQQKAHISCLTFYTRTQTHTLSSNKGFVVNVPINLKNRETVALSSVTCRLGLLLQKKPLQDHPQKW